MKTNTSKKLWSLFAVALIAFAGIAFALPAEKDFAMDSKQRLVDVKIKTHDFPLKLISDIKASDVKEDVINVDYKKVDYKSDVKITDVKKVDYKRTDVKVVDIARDLRKKDTRATITGQPTAVPTLNLEAVPRPMLAAAENYNIPLEALQTLYENRAYVWTVDGAGMKRDSVPLMFGGYSSLQTMVMGHQYRGKQFNYWNGDVYIQGKLTGDVHGIYTPASKKNGAFLGYFRDSASGAMQLGLGIYMTNSNGQKVWYLYNPESPTPASTVLQGASYIGFREM